MHHPHQADPPSSHDGEVPELALERPDSAPGLSNGWIITASMLGIVALLAVAVGVANLRSSAESADGGDDPESVEQPELVDTEPRPADIVNPLGPRDGLDSLGHPVVVEPSTGLVDAQTVMVTGSEFPPNTDLGVVMCSGVVEMGGGAAQCQLSPFTSVHSHSDGTFETEFPMRRIIVIGGQEVDCAAPPPDGIANTCVVAVGAINDYDQSGVAPVGFDDSVPAPPPPTLSVTPSDGLVDGDLVTVNVDGVHPEWGWWPNLCTSIDPATIYGDASEHGDDGTVGEYGPHTGGYGTESWCEPLGGSWPEHEFPNGPVEVSVQRWFGALSGVDPIDCGTAPGHCWIEVYAGPRPIPHVPLSFDPSVPAPPPPPPPTYDEWGHLVTDDSAGGSDAGAPTDTTVVVP